MKQEIVYIANKTFHPLIVSLFPQQCTALSQASRKAQHKTAIVKGRVKLPHQSFHSCVHSGCPQLVAVNVNMLDWQSHHAR